MLHAIRLDFDPALTPFGLSVRIETLALAGIILLTLVLAGLLAGRARAYAERNAPDSDESRLRRDDLILMAFGAVPGAVAGGRLGYGLIHLDFYLSDPGALLDPGKGGLSLTGALLLGTVTALAVARLLGAPLRAWLHLTAGPLLLGLGLGKLATALGGSGQGVFSDASWATAYVAPGRWGSSSAADPAVPSQVIEGGLVLLVLACVVVGPQVLRLRATRSPRPGLRLAPAREWHLLAGQWRFVTALALWAAVRFVMAFTWRDGRVVGPLGVEQLVLAVLIFAWAWALVLPWAAAALRSRAESRAANRVEREASRAANRVEREASRAANRVEREARREANRQIKLEAKLEAKRQATLRAEGKAKTEAERKAKTEAQREAQRQAKRLVTLEAELEAKRKAKREAKLEAERQAQLEAERQAAVPTEAAPEYPRDESGSEVQVVPERARVEPAKRPTRRGTHRPRAPKPHRPPPGSGS